MNKKFLRDGFEYYLEIEAEGGEDYEYQMLLAGHIDTLLPVNVMSVNEKKQLIYSASGYKTLESCLEKMIINGEQILQVMESVLKGIDDIKQYLLSAGNLVLSPDCLFVEPDYSRVGLIYVPGYEQDIILQLRELIEIMLGRIESTDMKSVMLAWKLHTLIKDEHISLREIRKIMAAYQDSETKALPVTKEWEEQPEYREVKRTSAGKKIEWRSQLGIPMRLPILIGLVCMVIVGGAEIGVLISIYTGGIQIWKRNLLLILGLLFVLCTGITITFWKKEQVIRTMKELQEKMKERLTFS